MLEPDPDIRPDIYQVSAVVFQIMGKENPVQNLHVSCEYSFLGMCLVKYNVLYVQIFLNL